MRCPCINYLNETTLHVSETREHLLYDEFLRNYRTKMWHGELHLPSVCQTNEFVNTTMDDRLKDMIHDVGARSFLEALMYGNISTNTETPSYPGSTNFTRLSTVLKLMNLKAMNG